MKNPEFKQSGNKHAVLQKWMTRQTCNAFDPINQSLFVSVDQKAIKYIPLEKNL